MCPLDINVILSDQRIVHTVIVTMGVVVKGLVAQGIACGGRRQSPRILGEKGAKAV